MINYIKEGEMQKLSPSLNRAIRATDKK